MLNRGIGCVVLGGDLRERLIDARCDCEHHLRRSSSFRGAVLRGWPVARDVELEFMSFLQKKAQDADKLFGQIVANSKFYTQNAVMVDYTFNCLKAACMDRKSTLAEVAAEVWATQVAFRDWVYAERKSRRAQNTQQIA